MSYRLTNELHPNNETRLCLYPVREKRCVNEGLNEQSKGDARLEVESAQIQSESSEAASPPLDIRSDFRTICRAHSYARTEFGRDASRRIMRAGGAMDRFDSNRSHYLFLTATLPSDDEWAKWAIAEEAHHIIDGLKSWLSKRALDRKEFYVWEHQNRAALHLHYCIHVPDIETREWIKREFPCEWMRLLEGIEKRLNISMWGRWSEKSVGDKKAVLQVTVQEVRKSVAAYMAGYCGGVKNKHKFDSQKDWYPKRWYGISRPLSALIKEHTKKETLEFSSYRTAKLKLDEFAHENEQDSLHTVKYKHNVGRGESHVTYHTPEIQEQLWQSKKPMKFNKSQNPNTWYFVQLAATILWTCSELEQGSQIYRRLVSKRSRDVLSDSLYRDSLLRGSLRNEVLAAIELLYLELSSNLSLPPSLNLLLSDVTKLASLHSRNHHLMLWDKNGYLNVIKDFEITVDNPSKKAAQCTQPIGEQRVGDGIASRANALNGTESPTHPLQLNLWQH